jgi:hypothetical protein
MEPILQGSQYIFRTQLKPFTLDFSSLPTRVSVSPNPITILKHKTRKQNQVEIKQEILANTPLVWPRPSNKAFPLTYFSKNTKPLHPYKLVSSNGSLIALTSSELWPSKDRPQNALRAPWRLLGTGWPQMMDGLCGQNKGVTRVHPLIWS